MGLVLQNVTKRFGSGNRTATALNSVNFEVGDGEIVALLGPNGAGKTTLIKTATGLVRPDQGSVTIDGKSPHHDSSALLSVGAILEGNRNIYWRLTPLENLEYFGGLRNVPRRETRTRAMQLLELLGLKSKTNELAHTLSRGMQQKLALAVALLHQPKLLLLDEPTLGLDVESVIDIKRLIRELQSEGRAIVLTTHQLDIAQQVSDRIALIRDGTIIATAAMPDLIKRYSRNRYEVRVESALSAGDVRALEALHEDLEVRGDEIYFPQERSLFVAVMNQLHQHSVVSVSLGERSLEDIFLQLLQGPTQPAAKEVVLR